MSTITDVYELHKEHLDRADQAVRSAQEALDVALVQRTAAWREMEAMEVVMRKMSAVPAAPAPPCPFAALGRQVVAALQVGSRGFFGRAVPHCNTTTWLDRVLIPTEALTAALLSRQSSKQ